MLATPVLTDTKFTETVALVFLSHRNLVCVFGSTACLLRRHEFLARAIISQLIEHILQIIGERRLAGHSCSNWLARVIICSLLFHLLDRKALGKELILHCMKVAWRACLPVSIAVKSLVVQLRSVYQERTIHIYQIIKLIELFTYQ